MKNLRRWQLTSSQLPALTLAADARLNPTDYADDQAWELLLGTGESPALALQTRYGGRVGLASIVPMWFYDRRSIYQAQAYAEPPELHGFAPGYLQINAKLTPTLNLQAEFWAMESRATGSRFTVVNTGTRPETLRLDLFGYVIADDKEQELSIIALGNNRNALFMGEVANIQPVLVLENGQAAVIQGRVASPKIGVDLEIRPKKSGVVRWVHAGLATMQDSLTLAQNWLKQDWNPHFKRIDRAAQDIPIIETGNREWDTTIALAYHQLVQAYMRPTASLPYTSFVGTRQSWQGFSPRGDGTDHPRAWSGQTPTLAYLTASAMASVDPDMAKGVLRNYLAVQKQDGWIDYQPGLAGQTQNMLCMPILSRLAWNIYQASEDKDFLAEVYPKLHQFFDRWFESDMDRDQDGFPEWQSERQTGYVYMPTFAAGQAWAQNADVRLMETPDMLAYLLSEAVSLRAMADVLGKKSPANQLEKRINNLKGLLQEVWREGRYTYRDRDTHTGQESVVIVESGAGDEEHLPALPLVPPNRVIVRIIGGVSMTPRVKMVLEGLDDNGRTIREEVDSKAFVWGYGRGVYTSQRVFAQVDRVRFEGLSRVYRVQVVTVDHTYLDINALLPLWSGDIPAANAKALVQQIVDKQVFWRPTGVVMSAANSSVHDPANPHGGGVWPFWLTLVGEGLLYYGYAKQAARLIQNVLETQTTVLKDQRYFFEFYHSDDPKGSGERGHLGGIVPLHLLMQVLGVRIISSGKVWVGGIFEWGRSIRITRQGVTVMRSAKQTKIRFPSGHTVELAPNPEWQQVVDPKPLQLPPVEKIDPPSSKKPRTRAPKSVIIKVQLDSEDPDEN